MTDPSGADEVARTRVSEHGADAATRDETGARYGGEQLGRHPGPLIWSLMGVIIAGSGVAGAAVILSSLVWFIIGVVIMVVGGVASLAAGVMQMTE
jgi:hypothetical protein